MDGFEVLRALIAPLVFASGTTCFAAPPADFAPDPALREWFHSLLEPGTQHVCCDVSDCRFVPVRIRSGHYEVDIEGWHYIVPRETVIPGITNPTGKAVACYTYAVFEPPSPPGSPRDRPQDIVEILCFVPPRP